MSAEKQGFQITLTSQVPFIAKYDENNENTKTKLGKFFDEMNRIGCPCTIQSPSENSLIHGDPNPFYIGSSDGHFHRSGSASYGGMGLSGSSIIGAVEKFVENVLKMHKEGYGITQGTDSNAFYKLVVVGSDITLVQVKNG